MLTMKQKLDYLKEANESWAELCKSINEEFTAPYTLKNVCWEAVEEDMKSPHKKTEEVEYDEEELFKQLDEDLKEIKRQEALFKNK